MIKNGLNIILSFVLSFSLMNITVFAHDHDESHDLNDCHISVTCHDTTYTGSAIKPTVSIDGYECGKDYTVSYSHNTCIGKATITIKGINGCTGTVTKNFYIRPQAACTPTLHNASKGINIKWEKDKDATGYKIYRSANGGEYKYVTKTCNLSYNDTAATINGRKYKYKIMAYKTVDGININASSYSSAKTTYKVNKTCLDSVSSGSGKFTCKWTKNSAANGYVIYYSTHSDMSCKKSKCITSNDTCQTTISSLCHSKKYYVNMRAYKLVSGTKYYSVYSDNKCLTTKA